MPVKTTTLIAGAALLFTSSFASAQTVMRIGLNDDPDTIDPALSQAFVTRIVLTTFCDKLFDIDEKLNLVPRLAESYEWSQDGLALTFKLRPDVVFHDGEPLDADAVKFNIERNKTIEGTFRRPELGPIESVDVVDPLTVRLNLSAPSAPMVSVFADRSGMMVSPKAAEKLGTDFGSAPVCAGPFKFVSRVPQGQIVFEKFEDYWDVANVHIDRVEMTAVNDPTVRLSNLQSGQFDLIERLSPTDVQQVEADPALNLISAADLGYGYVQFNVGNGPRSEKMKDQRVREAIDLAIDREALVQVAFDGAYVGGDQVIPPASFYHDETRPLQKRDVERARELLAEAGQENFTFEMMVRPDRDFQVPAQVMQAMLSEAGITMIINTTENVTQLEASRQGNYESYMSFWSGRVDPDGNTFMFYTCTAGTNRMGYCKPEVEELLTKARQTLEPEARKAIYKQAMDIKYHDRPDLALWHRQLFMATSTDVENYKLFPDGLIRLHGVKLN